MFRVRWQEKWKTNPKIDAIQKKTTGDLKMCGRISRRGSLCETTRANQKYPASEVPKRFRDVTADVCASIYSPVSCPTSETGRTDGRKQKKRSEIKTQRRYEGVTVPFLRIRFPGRGGGRVYFFFVLNKFDGADGRFDGGFGSRPAASHRRVRSFWAVSLSLSLSDSLSFLRSGLFWLRWRVFSRRVLFSAHSSRFFISTHPVRGKPK